MSLIPAVVLVGALAGGFSAGTVQAQSAADDMKIWEGAFSAVQVAHGKTVYQENCQSCHGAELKGMNLKGGEQYRNPPLVGDAFFENWETATVDRLLGKIEAHRPNDGMALRTDQSVDVTAFILHANGFPEGTAELKRDASVNAQLRIMKKGVSTAPNFAVVQVLGCLSEGGNKAWTLTDATEPIVAKADSLTPEELRNAASQSLGDQTFRVFGAGQFTPDRYKGQKMMAKAVLRRAPEGDSVDVLVLQPVGSPCVK